MKNPVTSRLLLLQCGARRLRKKALQFVVYVLLIYFDDERKGTMD